MAALKLEQPPNSDWSAESAPRGAVVVYRPRKARGFSLAFSVTAFFGAAALWVVWSFVYGWLIGGEEILPAGAVVCLLALGCVLLAIKWMCWIFRTTTYEIEIDKLTARTKVGRKITCTEIEKSRISGLYRILTPVKSGGSRHGEIWVASLSYAAPGGKDKRFSFEGYTQAETDWILAILSQWCGQKIKNENTSD